MNDEDYEIDKDALINGIYQAQVDLRILAEWIARQAHPVVDNYLLYLFSMMRERLELLTPNHARH